MKTLLMMNEKKEMTEKEAITEWSRISDTEIKRKLREYPKSGE